MTFSCVQISSTWKKLQMHYITNDGHHCLIKNTSKTCSSTILNKCFPLIISYLKSYWCLKGFFACFFFYSSLINIVILHGEASNKPLCVFPFLCIIPSHSQCLHDFKCAKQTLNFDSRTPDEDKCYIYTVWLWISLDCRY